MLRVLAAGLAAVALPVTLARLLGPLGADTVTPGAQLAGLAPLAGPVLAVALLVAVVARALGHRRARAAGRGGGRGPAAVLVVVLAAALACHAVWALGPLVGGTRAGEGSTGVAVRVLAVNARFGGADPAAVVDLVAAHEVDVLALTELTPGLLDGLRAAGVDRLLPHEVVAVAPEAAGSGTFSRWPLTALPAPGTTFTTVRTRVAVPGAPGGVTLTTVHTWPPLPGSVDRWRRDHAALREAVAADPAPRVVAGDLNATPDHSVYRRLLAAAGLRPVGDPAPWAPTWPSDQPVGPFLRLDHVLVDDEVSVPGARRDLYVPGTDHLAVLATVEVGPAPGR